jgi:hypothetical protein
MNKRSITLGIWTDAWFEELKAAEKLVWLHLLTHPNSNMIGFFDISIKRIASDCSLERTEVEQALSQFANQEKAFVYGTKVWLCNFVKHQDMNPNMMKNAKTGFIDIPEEVKKQMFSDNNKAFVLISEAFGMVTEAFGMVRFEKVKDTAQVKLSKEKVREEKTQEGSDEVESEETTQEKIEREMFALFDTPNALDRKPSFDTTPTKAELTTEQKIGKIYDAYPKQVGEHSAKRAILHAFTELRKDGQILETYFVKHGANVPEDIRASWNADVSRFLLYKVKQMATAWEGVDTTFCPNPEKWFSEGRYLDSKTTYTPKEKKELV